MTRHNRFCREWPFMKLAHKLKIGVSRENRFWLLWGDILGARVNRFWQRHHLRENRLCLKTCLQNHMKESTCHNRFQRRLTFWGVTFWAPAWTGFDDGIIYEKTGFVQKLNSNVAYEYSRNVTTGYVDHVLGAKNFTAKPVVTINFSILIK